MQRLGHIGSSPDHAVSEGGDISVLNASVPTETASPIGLPELDGPEVEDSALMVQVDEVRLRRLIDESFTIQDEHAPSDGPAEQPAKATLTSPTASPRGSRVQSDERLDEPADRVDRPGQVPSSAGARRVKRAIDIAGSLALLAAASPVLATCAVLIRRGSHGPIFFRQKRIGQDGRAFTMLKLRTMYVDADSSVHEAYVKRYIAGEVGAEAGNDATVFKLVGDARITPVGRWLRKLSLDELPQLINVLRGDMSLVGPRPPLPYEVEHYRPRALQRLRAKPGITGLWQVSGRNQTTFDEMIDLDLQYIEGWSVWRDLWILCRTIPVVLFPDGH